MERRTFHLPEVVRELQRFVEVRLHTDVEAEWSEKLLAIKEKRLAGDQTMPVYEVIDPSSGRTLGTFRGADISGERFAAFLRKYGLPG